MRALTDDFDPDVVTAVQDRLGTVVAGGVAIPWAVESGSRAWGFPSPDSDYDCRFYFVRPVADYLGPWRPRDVIETPLDAVLDVNGWGPGQGGPAGGGRQRHRRGVVDLPAGVPR